MGKKGGVEEEVKEKASARERGNTSLDIKPVRIHLVPLARISLE